MRIAVVTEEFAPGFGGVREQVQHFAREARRLGHVVKVVTGDPGAAARPAEGEEDVVRIGASRPVLRGGVVTRVTGGAGAALRGVLARERFDVVHVHAPLTPVLPLLALHHATGPVVGTFHAHARPGLLLRLARRMAQRYLDRLDAAVAASRACLGRLEGRLRGEVRIVPAGVDTERFARGRRIPRFDDGKLNVLWMARAERRNGLDLMLSAFHRAWRQIDARLLVVGDGPTLRRVRASLPSDLADDVVFAGRVDDERPDWYATADVVCATAQTPSGGITLLEAMAAGKPVLASDVPGYRDLLQHGREGELVAAADEGAWARAIVRLSRESVRAGAYGERGRIAAQRHAWPVVTRELLGIYRSVGALG
ncbi:MAG TPA: glycosyltransferase family 4 protein [Anaeromyxobacter sp.]|nr:glycosyltransferase family 4 protein [Anaeromyxobacter sp.]